MWHLSIGKAKYAVTMLRSLREAVQYSSMAGIGLSQTHPLKGEKSRQFLTSDTETIVCVHPSSPADISCTKPLRMPRPGSQDLQTSISSDEADLVRKLRRQDPELWTVSVLSKLFNVRRNIISDIAPASDARIEEISKSFEFIKQMKRHQRKVFLAQQAVKREKRLKDAITNANYNFPGKL